MHLMRHNAKITALMISVLIYSCNASNGGSTARTVDQVGKTSHQSTRPPETSNEAASSHAAPASSSKTTAPLEKSKSSYAMLSQAMTEAVHHEFSSIPGSGATNEGSSCLIDDFDCLNHDQLGMEAIKNLHRQLDDDEDGDIDLAESDDFLREELKYESGYEKRHKAFHHNDEREGVSVKELWEAWLRSEVHNWTVDQTTEWLAQSVQLPQYVRLFRQHKVTGRVLPLLAVNNMHYVSNVLGIKDPIHKQKIALKAMDAVLFGPPRETGTRWKDLLLVALLLTAIIGSWYAYQQNKNAKFHLRRMAKDMEGLHKAEVALQEMQKELERARMEQENVGKEKQDLERRLKEAPALRSSDSDLEVQQLKQEIEMLRSELSRAEGELVDQCYSPPAGLQVWLQLTYELESKYHLKKRVMAEKQLQQAREACEKLKRKRSSLYGAFVSTHGKSIDDVDRSIVEAKNSLTEVTNELQERTHRWKQIETLLGFSIMTNNGISYLENVLYNKNGSRSLSRGRMSSSQDDLDDESVQALLLDGVRGRGDDNSSAGSDETDHDSVSFVLGSSTNITSGSSSSSTPTTATTGTSMTTPHHDSVEQPPAPVLPRTRQKLITQQSSGLSTTIIPPAKAPLPPPRRIQSQQSLPYGRDMARSKSADMVTMESTSSTSSSPVQSGAATAIAAPTTTAVGAAPFSIPQNTASAVFSATLAGTFAGTRTGIGGTGIGTRSTESTHITDQIPEEQLSIGSDSSSGHGLNSAEHPELSKSGRRRKLPTFSFGKKSNKSKAT